MIPIEFYLLLVLVLSSLVITFNILRRKKFKARFLIFSIIPLSIYLVLIFYINIEYYVPLNIPKSENWLNFIDMNKIILVNISQFALAFSLVIFIFSFYDPEKIILDLYHPSLEESRNGKIKLGKIIKNGRKKNKFYLSIHDLERHMFVCGSTGSGKSNFLQNFLINLKKRYEIPIMLVEFKGEYNFLQDKFEDLLIIRPGENFSINIFNPEGSNPEIHAERIFEIFRSAQMLETNAEYTPQMQKVLVDILTDVCTDKNNRNWDGFYEKCEQYYIKEKKNITYLEQTLISIKNRIRRYSLGPIKAIFNTKNKLNIKDLFDRDILIDLSSIIRLGGEKEDALFFLNMILKYLWDRNLSSGSNDYKTIRHMTIIEDAQYFAPRGLSDQTKISTYIEDIALLLRGTGECLISLATRPNVSEEILANCGVLIAFKNHMQKELLRKLLNLDSEQEEYLSMLKMGYCIVRVNSIEKPFLLYIPFIKRHSLKIEEINENNQRILQKGEINTELAVKRSQSNEKLVNKLFQFFKKLKYKVSSTKLKQHSLENENLLKEDDLPLPQIQSNINNIQRMEANKIIEEKDESFIRLKEHINNLAKEQNNKKNPKSILHEFCQKKHFSLPIYNMIRKSGLNHSPTYTIELIIKPGDNINNFQEIFKNNHDRVEGNGRSKKSAEIEAARKMCEILGLLNYT